MGDLEDLGGIIRRYCKKNFLRNEKSCRLNHDSPLFKKYPGMALSHKNLE